MNTEAERAYRCQQCTYDVSQTLRDSIRICPECGGAISEEASAPPIVDNAKLGSMERWYGLLVLALWFAETFVNPPAPTSGLLGLSSLLAAIFGGMHCARAAGLLIEKPHAKFRIIASEAVSILLYALVFAMIPGGIVLLILTISQII